MPKDYVKEQLAQSIKHQKQLEKLAPKIHVPTGFETRWQDGYSWQGHTAKDFVIFNKELDVEFICRPGGDGTTRFKNGDHYSTYDRTGVESSFYWLEMDYGPKPKAPKLADMAEIVKDHLVRIEKSRDYQKTAISVPQIGFTVSPKTRVEYTQRLKTQGHISFTPSGFGTGYTISTKKLYSYSTAASKELVDFWGVGPLWVSTMDCD